MNRVVFSVQNFFFLTDIIFAFLMRFFPVKHHFKILKNVIIKHFGIS